MWTALKLDGDLYRSEWSRVKNVETSKVLNVFIDSNGFEKMKIDGLKLANLMLPIQRAPSPNTILTSYSVLY